MHTAAVTDLDPAVELLPDVPVSHPDEDLLERAPYARRLVELACAQPAGTPRVIALVGTAGSGKSSVLNLATGQLLDRGDVSVVGFDAGSYASADSLHVALVAHLTDFFSKAGVVDATDAIRDRLAGYGDLVSGVARIAGVKVDVGSVVRRSPDQVRAEIAAMSHEVGRRMVIAVDHVDRMPARELAATLEILRHYSAIPFVTFILALDRRATSQRLAAADLDLALLERIAQVELSLPAANRVLLARVLAGGLARTAARLGRDVDGVLAMLDPDAREALILDLIETVRDAKRVVNALTAALPLIPAGPDVPRACLELVLRLLVPELDVPNLSSRAANVDTMLRGHPHEHAARAALRGLYR